MKFVIIGIGNRFRGDDEAGLLVAGAVRKSLSEGVSVKTVEEPCDLMEALEGFDCAFIADACVCDLPAGEVAFSAFPAIGPEFTRAASVHTITVEQILRIGYTLGRLPASLNLIGVSAKEFEIGSRPSEPVREGAKRAAEEIARRVDAWAT